MTVREKLDSIGLWASGELTLDAAATMASPSWWGADSERFSVRSSAPDPMAGTAAFVKLMEPHASGYVDIAAAFEAAKSAGEAGIGPRVYTADVEHAVLVMEDFTDLASTAKLDLFDGLERAEQLVAIRKAVRHLPEFLRRATVFDDLRSAHRLVLDAGGSLPADFEWMMRSLAPAEQRIEAAGYDVVPCHGDANVSNVLVMKADETLRLVDWDCAALMDPLQDLGVLLQEIRPLDVDARPVFEMYWGCWDSSLFDRCRVYAIADCIRWGLIGLYTDACRPETLEYSKFSDWQFFRARAGLRDPHFDDRVRNL